MLVELQRRYLDRGLAVIGIAVGDGLAAVQAACRELHVNYPVAMNQGKLDAAFGSDGVPTSFLIGRDARIYSKHVGAASLQDFEEEVSQLLAADETAELADFRPAGDSEPAVLPAPAELNSEVPGVDISRLNAAQLEGFKTFLANELCDCGCRHSVLQCLKEDGGCAQARRQARAELEKFLETKSSRSQHRSD